MIDATPNTCRHGVEVKGLEVISLDAITPADPSGLVDAEVPVAMRQAVADRVAGLELVNPYAGYRINQVHADGCRTLATDEATPSTPAEMFAHLADEAPVGVEPLAAAPAPAPVRHTPAEPLEAPVRLEAVGPRGATTTGAQARAYAVADALRAAAWDVLITIENVPPVRSAYGEATMPGVRVVTLTATRHDSDGAIMAEWYSVTECGRRTTRNGPAELRRGGKATKLRTRAALAAAVAEAVEGGPRPLEGDEVATLRYAPCRECGTADLMHVEGCRAVAVRAEILTRPLAGGRLEVVPVGWAVFCRGTTLRAMPGVFAEVGEARRYATLARGLVAAAYGLEVRPVA